VRKINIGRIVSDHLKTLRDFDTDKASIPTSFCFFASPLLWGRHVPRNEVPGEPSANRRKFLREIHQNLSFSILVSIVVVVLALLGMTITQKRVPNESPKSHPLISFLLTYFISNFLMTLLMIVKRIHLLLAEEFSGPRATKKVA
jgi:hypothetical protein